MQLSLVTDVATYCNNGDGALTIEISKQNIKKNDKTAPPKNLFYYFCPKFKTVDK